MPKYACLPTVTIVFFVFVVLLPCGVTWGQSQSNPMDAARYADATGQTITAFDNKTDRWIAEMKEEPVEVIVQKLTDAAEYFESTAISYSLGFAFDSDKEREETIYSREIHVLLGNRRFRKAYEDLQKINKQEAAELLTNNIRENLAELHVVLQGYKSMVARGDHKGNIATTMWIDDGDTYRLMSSSNHPPTPAGRRYAVLSHILLASHLELQEVRPVVEEVVKFAKEEYRLFNSIPDGIGAGSFKLALLKQSLYNPSLLATATLCDPTWNAEKRKLFEAKLVEKQVVDWQARSTEYDMPGREGWVPVVSHGDKIKIRYYAGITDAEFNDFFGK